MNARAFSMAFAAFAFALACGCSQPNELSSFQQPCTTDGECAANQVCFADGCGDPGEGLTVELLPSSANKQYIQDIAIDRLSPVTNIEGEAPAVLQGELQQEMSNNGGTVAYAGDITVNAEGESVVIPGRTRSVTFTVTPDNGSFQVPVHSGAYRISLTTKDPIFPPVLFSDVRIHPGAVQNLDTTFQPVSALQQVSGTLLKTRSPRLVAQTTPYDVQAFDVESNLPISQRVPASSGNSISDGSFVLWVSTSSGARELIIKAFPRTPDVLGPTKSFRVPLSSDVGELELGDFGVPVNITGRVLAKSGGAPLPFSRVHIEGVVAGGGVFKGPTVTADAMGVFALSTLPTGAMGQLDIIAEPTPDATAATVRAPIVIPLGGGSVPDVQAPDKVTLLGSLVRPDGEAASEVYVTAEPLSALSEDLPTPRGPTETTTDEDGRFSLQLDPGEYRLDFVSTDGLPRVSRFVRVDPPVGYTGEGRAPLELPTFSLSLGRTITGTIFAIPRPQGTRDSLAPAPNATFKFFRVVTFEGKRSSLLLAEGAANADGTYKVILPTR